MIAHFLPMRKTRLLRNCKILSKHYDSVNVRPVFSHKPLIIGFLAENAKTENIKISLVFATLTPALFLSCSI